MFSSMVETVILTLTGYKTFDQFTLTYKVKIVTESAFRLSFNQHVLGTEGMYGVTHAITYLSFTSDAPWLGVIHFTEERD